MSFKKLTTQIVDFKSLISAAAGILIALAAASTQIEKWVDEISERIYANNSKPAYVTVEFDLLKQLEKLTNDPSDVKFSDIQKFLYFCEKDVYFRDNYIPLSSSSKALEIACVKVVEEYEARYNSAYGGKK